MNSTYLTSVDKISKRKPIASIVIVSLVLAIIFGLFSSFTTISKNSRTAEAFDVTQWAMCYFGKESLPGIIYQTTNSSDLQFALRSKSSITGGVDDVEKGLNYILDIFGPSFAEVNETITGYPLEAFEVESTADSKTPKEGFNKGIKVNPFDRFGVAGLKFSSYSGEWKHVVIDACNTEGAEPQDPKAGVFYEGRLEARSTWEDIPNSNDVRSMQFGKGFGSQFSTSYSNLIANGIFNVTKGIVVIVIGLISFSFTDLVEVMGINELLIGSESDGGGGIFKALFSGIFMPLIVLAFALTGIYIFWIGLAKKRYRESMNVVLRSIALFVLAVIISIKPTIFVNLANNIAIVSQSIIITSMNSGLAGGNGMCSTDIGASNTKLVTDTKADPVGILEQASTNMRSAVGCQYWQTFLLRPWAEGQWGTGWEKTWAKDKTPSWTSGGAELKNTNESMVGDAAVPMGDGSFINNWAIFQISTQTNVHSPIGHEGERPKYTAGVANDWWRIVDTLSNYQEQPETYAVDGTGPYGASNEFEYEASSQAPVLDSWDTWVGNEASNRIWTAMSSAIIAIVGLFAPLVFAFLSALYSVGVSILMAFMPIMLLLGCWANTGWELFKSWGELVINTTIKRIVTGALLALSIGFTITIIKLMESTSWWQGILLLIVVSLVLFKSRTKIIDMLANVKFASTDLSGSASKISNTVMGVVKTTRQMGTNTLVAGVSARKHGGTFAKGAAAGIKTELKNKAYSTPALQNIMTEYDQNKTAKGEILEGQEYCDVCRKRIDYEADQLGMGIFHGGRTDSGNLVCYECFSSGFSEDAIEVRMERQDYRDREKKPTVLEEQQSKIRSKRFRAKTAFTNSSSKDMIEQIKNKVDKDGNPLDPSQNTEQLKRLLKSTNYDIANNKKGEEMPVIPDEIKDSMNHDLLKSAWDTGNYEWIRQAYVAAWATWFVEVTSSPLSESLDELLGSIETHATDKKKDGK